MECARPLEGHRLREGVREFLREAEGFVAPLQGLRWIPEQPQGPGRIREARHLGILSIERNHVTVLLGVIDGEALLQVRAGRGQHALEEQRRPQRPMGLQPKGGALEALRQVQALFSQVVRCR
jgi:hypothetical protein